MHTESKRANSGPALLLLVMCSTQRHLTHPCVHLNLSRRVPYKHFCSYWGIKVLLPQYFFCEALCKMNATIPSGSYPGKKKHKKKIKQSFPHSGTHFCPYRLERQLSQNCRVFHRTETLKLKLQLKKNNNSHLWQINLYAQMRWCSRRRLIT